MLPVVFFLGKGGVGKTTLACASAYRFASHGKRVLLCSLDPAHNVGDLFHTPLTNKPRRIRENLEGIEVDLKEWIRTYLEQSKAEIQETYRYVSVLNLEKYLDIMNYAPGTEEYAVLWAIEHLYTTYKESHDCLIFDTPPTALTLRFLAMPALTNLWIQELSRLRATLLEKRRTLLKLNPEAAVLGGTIKKEEDPLYGKLQNMQRRLKTLQELFSQHSYISVVLNPDELSLAETLRINEELKKLKIPIASLCYNKVLTENNTNLKIQKTLGNIPLFTFNYVEGGILALDDLAKIEISPLIQHIRSYA
ncbi:MAG: ArsA family ATPase [Treponemataceae bacterium]|uniref:ArsA family ATPase n=1 Tax=Treponema sp. J25 TaxID=2094121 RepID=UPI001043679E|nr:ArsA family ATPase [Treponema sp. J25]MCX7948930.1 ArsA family ATPase [Treponemataceae bacterium]TCW60268.1 arsenic-transporting ATPase [Treponema sp. J25]